MEKSGRAGGELWKSIWEPSWMDGMELKESKGPRKPPRFPALVMR